MSANHTDLKHAVIEELKRSAPATKDVCLTDMSVQDAHGLIFRAKDSLRLTYTGYIMMRSVFEAYSFEIEQPLMAKNLIALGKLSYPYFITSKRLVIFSQMDAMTITIAGSVNAFLENHI